MNNLFSLDSQVNFSKSLVLFILLVSANFIGNTLGCKTQYFLNHNKISRHIFGFLSLLFSVNILLDIKIDDEKDPSKKRNLKLHETVLVSLLIYLFYLISSRTHWEFTLLIYSMVITIYILSIVKKDYFDEDIETKKKIDKFTHLLFYLIIIVTFVSFIIYTYDKYLEYGPDLCKTRDLIGLFKKNPNKKKCFSIKKFIFGPNICSNSDIK